MKKILPFFVFLLVISCQEQGEKTTDPFENNSSVSKRGEVEDLNNDTNSFNSDFKLDVYVAENPDLGNAGAQFIETRLLAAISKYGISGSGANPRFFIGPVVNLLSKNVTSTSPTKYMINYEITLLAVDAVNQTKFASYTFTSKGVGDSPDKACINAFVNEKFQNNEFYDFLKEAETKILSYYNKNCDVLIAEAEAEAKVRNFSSAYTILNNVPKECTECFKKVTSKRTDYFQMSLNLECQSLLANMKSELGKFNDPTASGFNNQAMSYYSLIDRQSSCFPEAEKLYKSYIAKLNPKGRREWDQKMKDYEHKISMANKEFDFKREHSNKNFEYLMHKDEMAAKAEIEGNKKLLQKYNYDELPWIRRIFTPRQHVD